MGCGCGRKKPRKTVYSTGVGLPGTVSTGTVSEAVPAPVEPGCFDAVYLLNLDRRPDRLAEFMAQITEFPFKQPVRFSAVDGSKETPPSWFTQGGGAWGCRSSHLAIWEDALKHGHGKILVFEDDALLLPGFGEAVQEFLEAVPDDWHYLGIGGQLFQDSKISPVNSRVRKVTQCERTHCYAMSKSGIESALEFASREDQRNLHIDWMAGNWQETVPAYAPIKFLCKQRSGKSDITGRFERERGWSGDDVSPEDRLAIHLEAPKDVMERLVADGLIHCGYDRGEDGVDRGLHKLSQYAHEPVKTAGLKRYWSTICVEAFATKTTPCIWMPGIDRKLVETLGKTVVFVRVWNYETARKIVGGMIERHGKVV